MQQIYLKEFNNEEIGMGFNSLSGKAVGTSLDVGEITENKVAPGMQVQSEITIINSHEELMNKLGMSFEAQGRYGAFSASVKANFSESSSYNSTSTFLVARCIVTNSFIRGRNFRVKPEAEALLKSNRFDEFSTAFGDSFVRGLQTGGEFYCIIRVTSIDTKKQSELGATLQAEFNGLVGGGSFKAQYGEANSSSLTKSEYTATMYQRGGKGEQIKPVIEISEALQRYREFPIFALQNPVGYETEIASYNTIPLPLPTPEEQENFNLALRDAREKKLYYIQKKNDLEFAFRKPEFFEDLPAPEILQDAINAYIKLSIAAMEHGAKLSRGEIKPPTLFSPPINEPVPIKLKRITPPTHVTVPNVVGLPWYEADSLLKERGLNPKHHVTGILPNSTEKDRIVLRQEPEGGKDIPRGSDVQIYYNRRFGGGHRQETFEGISWKPPLKLYRATYRQIPYYGHFSFLYPYYYPGFIAAHPYVHHSPIRTVVYPYSMSYPIPGIPNYYSIPGETYPYKAILGEARDTPEEKVAEGFLTAAGEEAVNQVKNILGTINASRSVILILENNTNMKLRKVRENLQHGGWAVTPVWQILPVSTLVFGAMSASWSIGTGTEGSITYAGEGIELTIYWDNPYVGSNSCNIQLTGPKASKYYTNSECGSGNQAAQMRYELYPR
ncbi:PASTA domain-containing protein [Peribacillus butanolivorans]|uniref:PASTA domain-containing protein n=1 Tax=Peribacillus butanolivorans TaxID=421767 RepID=UPI0039FC3D80